MQTAAAQRDVHVLRLRNESFLNPTRKSMLGGSTSTGVDMERIPTEPVTVTVAAIAV